MTRATKNLVLLAASSGPLLDAFSALLLTLPQIVAVRAESQVNEILQAAEANPFRLAIVIVEAQPGWVELPGMIRNAAPDCRVIVIANGENEFEGAHLVLQQGARPDSLVAAVLSMLAD